MYVIFDKSLINLILIGFVEEELVLVVSGVLLYQTGIINVYAKLEKEIPGAFRNGTVVSAPVTQSFASEMHRSKAFCKGN